MKQQTIRQAVSYSGIALHTGVRASLTLLPAPVNSGIIFRRVDLPNQPEVVASVFNVVDVRRGTTIASGEGVVYTVEHILSALHAKHIDNCIVEMDGGEPPIADGSAMPYLKIIESVGSVEQDEEAQYWTATEPIIVEDRDTKVILTPADCLKITCIVSFGVTPLDNQYLSMEIDESSYKEQIASARTFCDYRDLSQLIGMGLVKGGSLDNAVIMHNGAIISKDGLRYPNEFVRHKILDLVGDLFLVGSRVHAHIIAVKSGHPSHVVLAKEMMKQKLSLSKKC